MKDNECVLFVRGIYPFFCDKFVIEKHLNYKLLEDSKKENAYLLSNVKTVGFHAPEETESAELHSEPVEEQNSTVDVKDNQSDKS